MNIVVYVLSAALVLAGAVLIAMGAPIVHLEQGWTEVIAGAVIGSTGLVIFVLGVFLARFDALRLSIETLATQGLPQAVPAVVDMAVLETKPEVAFNPTNRPAERVAADVEVRAPERRPVPPIVEASTQDPAAEPSSEPDSPGLDGVLPAPSLTVAPVRPAEPASRSPAAARLRERPSFMSSFLARRAASAAARSAPPPVKSEPPLEPMLTPLPSADLSAPPARTSIDLSSGWSTDEVAHADHKEVAGRVPEASETVEHEAAAEPTAAPDETDWRIEPPLEEPRPAPAEAHPAVLEPEQPAHPLAPTVVGRYNAGSASYVMYSNGMIEVETETGVHLFGSMQELKAFIEQRDAARV